MTKASIISRKSLHEEIVVLVRDMLLNGDLLPGQKVPEQQLCKRFGVSRTPMREALKVLAAEGLLQLTPNRGVSVAAITMDKVEELFPIMGSLEALAGELSCEKMTDTEIANVRAIHDAMVQHFRNGDYPPYAKLNKKIHDALVRAAGNDTLHELYESLMVKTHSVRFVARKSMARWQEAIDDHEEIIAALEARDGPRMARILRVHLQHKAGMVQESLAALDGQYAAPGEV